MYQDSGDTERDQIPSNPHGSTGTLLELPESPHSQLVNFFKRRRNNYLVYGKLQGILTISVSLGLEIA